MQSTAKSKVRCLTRVGGPDSEAELLELARGATTADLERMVRAYRAASRADGAARERALWRVRRVSVVPDDDGTYRVRGRLPAEVGAVLLRAIEAAADALFTAETREQATPEQRRADALGLVAERALAAGFGRAHDIRAPGQPGVSAETPGRTPVDAEGALAPGDDAHAPDGRPDRAGSERASEERAGRGERSARAAPISGTRAERYQVLLHVDRATLDPEAEPGRSHLEDGTRVSAETSRRLACDAALVRVERGRRGEVLSVGRRRRTVTPALRRALEVRDRGCRFPGCGLRFTDAHHVEHWAEGGETKASNLLLLCRFHHRLVHEGGWRLELWGRDRHPVFLDPLGRRRIDPRPLRTGAAGAARPHRPSTPPAPLRASDSPASVEALVRENRTRGVDPDGRACGARWRRENDIPWPVRTRAMEAMDRAF